jgi:ABC-type Mn2+/Zn2+ transport system ATPase subunit
MTPLVALEDASIGYGSRTLLSGVSVAVAPGDFLALIGPNGGGKTTLVRTLLGVLPLVAGRRVQPRPISVGYVPQRDSVEARWPLTAAEVTMMGRTPRLSIGRRPSRADHEAVAAALARTGIEALADRPFRTLSGGQRQRTLLARALAAEPDLLVLDEPANGMDPSAELATLDALRDLQAGGALAVAMVSHRIEGVLNYARTLAFVDWERGIWNVGRVEDVASSGALSALYGRPVTVREDGGRRFVHPGAVSSPRAAAGNGGAK